MAPLQTANVGGKMKHVRMQVKRNLHMVLSFSPVGGEFRERLRKFPSLVNCTTIDWFSEWPRDALHTVATQFLADLPGVDAKVCFKLPLPAPAWQQDN